MPNDQIVKQGRQGYSALAPGGPVIGIPGQFLRSISPGALHRARRGDSPIFEGEPGSEVIPGTVVTEEQRKLPFEDQPVIDVEPISAGADNPPDEDDPDQEELPPSSDPEPDEILEDESELPHAEPEELPTEENSKS